MESTSPLVESSSQPQRLVTHASVRRAQSNNTSGHSGRMWPKAFLAQYKIKGQLSSKLRRHSLEGFAFKKPAKACRGSALIQHGPY
jgi:hypothetical protein